MNDRERDPRDPDARPGRRLTTADLAQSAPEGRAPEPPARAQAGRQERDTPALFPPNELEQMRSQWGDIQSRFVDEPKRAVEDADNLVATAVQRLADSFARARSDLEGQWSRGGDVSTEDLRVALRRYRSFFDRLLSM